MNSSIIKTQLKQRWGQGRRNENRDQGRELILRAALTCYEKKGLSATSIEDVALTAKVSRRTVYRYFTTRQDIIQAAVEQQAYNFFLQMKKSVLRKQPNFIALLERCMLYAIKHGPTMTGYQLLLEGGNAAISAPYYFSSENVAQHWHDILSEPFDQAIKKGEISADIKLDALIRWIGRIILSYIQFPEPEANIKKQLKIFLVLR